MCPRQARGAGDAGQREHCDVPAAVRARLGLRRPQQPQRLQSGLCWLRPRLKPGKSPKKSSTNPPVGQLVMQLNGIATHDRSTARSEYGQQTGCGGAPPLTAHAVTTVAVAGQQAGR